MKRTNSIKRALMGVLLLGAAAAALAQPGGGPGGQGGPGGRGGPGGPGGMGRGPQSVMMLIQMTSVQKELHLTADQIRQISEMRPPQGGPGGRGGQGGGPGGQGGPGGGPGGFGGPGGQGGPGGGFGGPGGQGGQGGGPGGGFGGPGGQGGRGGGPGEEGGPGGQGGRGGRGGRGGQGGQGGRGGQGGGPGGFGGPGGQGGGPGGFGGPGGGPGNMPNPLADILTPEQMKRLDQLGLQFDAPFSITSPKVADQLELTQDQHEQIGEIIAKSFPRPQGDRQGPGGGQGDRQGPPQGGQGERPPQMNWAEMQAKKTTATRAVLAILSAEQKKTWQKVTGNPFTTWEEPKRR